MRWAARRTACGAALWPMAIVSTRAAIVRSRRFGALEAYAAGKVKDARATLIHDGTQRCSDATRFDPLPVRDFLETPSRVGFMLFMHRLEMCVCDCVICQSARFATAGFFSRRGQIPGAHDPGRNMPV